MIENQSQNFKFPYSQGINIDISISIIILSQSKTILSKNLTQINYLKLDNEPINENLSMLLESLSPLSVY